MKSLILSASTAVLLLSACGQSGELYLPDQPPSEVQKREQQKAKQESKQQQQQAPSAE